MGQGVRISLGPLKKAPSKVSFLLIGLRRPTHLGQGAHISLGPISKNRQSADSSLHGKEEP